MANLQNVSGLSPVNHLSGDLNAHTRTYCILPTDTNAYAIGDPVVSVANADGNGVPAVTLAAITGPIRGVIVGLGTSEGGIFNPNNLNSTIRPSGAQTGYWYAMVVDDPYYIFEVAEVSGGTQLSATSVGQNTNLVAGTNNGYQSGWMLGNSTVGTAATLQCRILGLVRKPGNSYGAYAKWLVTINNHELHAGTVGI